MKNILNNESGFVLVLALLIMTILVVAGISGLTTSNTEKKLATNELRYKQVFYTAESCVIASRAALFAIRAEDTRNLENLLNGTAVVGAIATGVTTLDAVINSVVAGGRTLEGVTYTTVLVDNDDSDDNLLMDTDGIIVLTCTANLETVQASTQTEIYYGLTDYDLQKGGDEGTSSDYSGI